MRASTRDRVRAGRASVRSFVRSFVRSIQRCRPMPIFGLSNDTGEFGLIRGSEARSNPRVDGSAVEERSRRHGRSGPKLAVAIRSNWAVQFVRIVMLKRVGGDERTSEEERKERSQRPSQFPTIVVALALGTDQICDARSRISRSDRSTYIRNIHAEHTYGTYMRNKTEYVRRKLRAQLSYAITPAAFHVKK